MKIPRPYIIDIEASGLDSNSYPIEVGIVLDKGRKFCSLIKPAKGWTHWDKEAENTHHISREMLQSHGQSVKAVAQKLNALLEGMILFSDGWAVDKPWLTKLFYEAKEEMKFQVSPIETLLTEAQMEIWHKTKDKIIQENNLTRHRASTDAWIIQETFFTTFKP